jgi:hypothetical protein
MNNKKEISYTEWVAEGRPQPHYLRPPQVLCDTYEEYIAAFQYLRSQGRGFIESWIDDDEPVRPYFDIDAKMADYKTIADAEKDYEFLLGIIVESFGVQPDDLFLTSAKSKDKWFSIHLFIRNMTTTRADMRRWVGQIPKIPLIDDSVYAGTPHLRHHRTPKIGVDKTTKNITYQGVADFKTMTATGVPLPDEETEQPTTLVRAGTIAPNFFRFGRTYEPKEERSPTPKSQPSSKANSDAGDYPEVAIFRESPYWNDFFSFSGYNKDVWSFTVPKGQQWTCGVCNKAHSNNSNRIFIKYCERNSTAGRKGDLVYKCRAHCSSAIIKHAPEVCEIVSSDTEDDDECSADSAISTSSSVKLDKQGNAYCAPYDEMKEIFEKRFALLTESVKILDVSEDGKNYKQYTDAEMNIIAAPYMFSVMKEKTVKGKKGKSYTIEEEEFHPFYSAWKKDPNRKTYENLTRNLDPNYNDSRYFNTWFGFPIEDAEPTDDEEKWGNWFRMLMDYFHNVISGGENIVAEYLIQWIAQLVQQPHIKYPATPLFYGKQGAGKTSFFNLISTILGKLPDSRPQICVDDSEFKNLLGRFNENMSNCILCLEEEVNFASTKKVYEEFKKVTGSKTYDIEIKCGAKYSIPNNIRIMMTTNNLMSIKVDEKERRLIPIKVSDIHLNDSTYWEKFYEFTSDVRLMRRTYDYFKNEVPLKPSSYFTKTPMTKYGEDLKEASKPPIDEWIIERSEDFINGADVYKSPELCDKYNKWLEARQMKPMTQSAFTLLIKNRDIVNTLFTWKKTKVGNVFNVHKDVYAAYIKKYEEEHPVECEFIDSDAEEEEIKEM